jgi:Flp pilus assembly pilin Flp
MNNWASLLRGMIRDERGSEVVEYSIVVALVVVACLAVMGKFGVKIIGRWSSIDHSLG